MQKFQVEGRQGLQIEGHKQMIVMLVVLIGEETVSFNADAN